MDASRAPCGEAAAAGNLGTIRRALGGGADPNGLVRAQAADGVECEATALVLAASNGQLEAVALLLECGASADKPNSLGSTPLMVAASNGQAAVLGLLLECGADLTVTHPEGATAFHFACCYNQPGCVAALVRAGCDTAAKTKGGQTGKEVAEEKGHTAVLESLRNLVAERLGEASREAALPICWHTLSCHVKTPTTGGKGCSRVDSTAHG